MKESLILRKWMVLSNKINPWDGIQNSSTSKPREPATFGSGSWLPKIKEQCGTKDSKNGRGAGAKEPNTWSGAMREKAS